MDNMKTGQLIRDLRKEKGMTQKELADKLHITDRAVSKWERVCAHRRSPCWSRWRRRWAVPSWT